MKPKVEADPAGAGRPDGPPEALRSQSTTLFHETPHSPVPPNPKDAASIDALRRRLAEKGAAFDAAVRSFSLKEERIPPLPSTKLPEIPTGTPHWQQIRQRWGEATNYRYSRAWKTSRMDFLAFAALAPMVVEGIWGAAYCAEQQGDFVAALAMLLWRQDQVAAAPVLARATAALAMRLRMNETTIRFLKAAASLPNGPVEAYVYEALRFGLTLQVVTFFYENPTAANRFDSSLTAYLLAKTAEHNPHVVLEVDANDSLSFESCFPTLLDHAKDTPTHEYTESQGIEATLQNDIRRLQDELSDEEIAVGEENTVGPYMQQVDAARRMGDYDDAQSVAAHALAAARSNRWKETFRKALAEIRAQRPVREVRVQRSLPPSTSPVNSARPRPAPRRSPTAPLWQQASDEAVRGNLPGAIALYEQFLDDAVKKGEWPERADQAVNGLTVVYNQQGKRDQAIATMRRHESRIKNRFPFHNQLATLYFISGQFSLAAEHFNKALSLAPGPVERQKAQNNARVAEDRAKQVRGSTAPQIVAQDDPTALELKREYLAPLHASIRMAEVTLELDPFLAPDVDRLTKSGREIKGLDRAKIARKEFDYSFVAELDRKAARVETTQGFRSQIIASALWVVYDRNWHQNEEALKALPDPRLLQTRLAGSLADDAAAQDRNAVAREYYCCVLQRNPNDNLAVASVGNYTRTLTGERFDTGSQKFRFERLRELLEDPRSSREVLWVVLSAASLSVAAYNALLKALEPVQDAIRKTTSELLFDHRAESSTFAAIVTDGARLISERQERVHGQFQRFLSSEFSIVRGAKAVFNELPAFDYDLPNNPIDFTKNGRVSRWPALLLQPILSYLNTSSPTEKHLHYSAVEAAIQSARAEIIEYPTRFARRTLLPILDRWQEELLAHYQEWERSVAPELTLRLEDVRKGDSYYDLHVLVSNARHCRTAHDVRVEITVNGWRTQQLEGWTHRAIDGGAAEPQSWRLEKSPSQPSVTSVLATATLTHVGLHGTPHKKEVEFDIPLRVIPYRRFESPYHPGPPVRDDAMLKGRDPLVNELCEKLSDSVRCTFVRVIGARRTGKSSVLEAVHRKLRQAMNPPVFVTERFDMGIAGSSTVDLLLETWADYIHRAARAVGRDIREYRPDSKGIATNSFLRWLADDVRPAGHPVLLLDEFQTIALHFDDLTLKGFFNFWKAMIEKRLLSGIVCGKDSMDDLIAQRNLGNQLASLQTEIVDYLDEKAARELIEKPIPLPMDLPTEFEEYRGGSRYTEGALKRILELTAASPFYIQHLCDKIVKILNRDEPKAMVVTELVVAKAQAELLRNESFVTLFENLTDFKPLLTRAGDENELEGRILWGIANSTRDRPGVDMASLIKGWPAQRRTNAIRELQRLIRRGVVLSDDNGMYQRVRVGLFKAWLQNNRCFEELEESTS
ncbi:MAG: hypothetical protein U0441_28505 [Polyangiaceae bacterium]